MKRLQMFKRLLELAAQVLEVTQERTQTARNDAKRAVRDFSHDAATGAEQLAKKFANDSMLDRLPARGLCNL